MHLEIDGERLPVNQLGPDFVILEATTARAPGPARLMVQVDEDHSVRQVFLPDGITRGALRTRLGLA